jgi:AcrR family transcriptional regulator
MSMLIELTGPQERLVRAAERLLAEKGLGAVSTREIAREAGQKNHSALNYHFGSFDGLISAILDFRMAPLNARRLRLLRELRKTHGELEVKELVRVMVEPLAFELLRPPEDSRYLRLLSQLVGHGEWQSMFSEKPERSSALLETGEALLAQLETEMDQEIAFERLRLLGLHVLMTVTEWDAMARRGELQLDAEALAWRVDNLVKYLAAALTAEE